MTNQFLAIDKIANRAVARLVNGCVAAQNVHRDFEADFAGKQGAKIRVPMPASFTANEFDRTTGIQIQNIVEDDFEVSLDKFLDVSVAVTDEDMTLTLDKFDERILHPMMLAIIEKIDAYVLALRDDVTAEVGHGGEYAWNDPNVLAEAGAVLTSKNVPLVNRRVFVGPMTHAAYITKPPFNTADKSGSTDALRNANLGRAFNFDSFQVPNIAKPAQVSGASTTEVNVAFEQDAFALVTRVPVIPQGATGAVASHKGFGIRVTYGWDQSKKQSVISADLLVGTKTIDANRAVLIKGTDVA